MRLETGRKEGLALISRIFFLCLLVLFAGCQTKRDVRQEQELAKLKRELRNFRGQGADVDVNLEETKMELSRLANQLEERAQFQAMQFDKIQTDLAVINTRLQALEQNAVTGGNTPQAPSQPVTDSPPDSPEKKTSYSQARKYFEAGKYRSAIAEIKSVISRLKPGQDRSSRFLLAESYYRLKDYRSAALEFAKFKKDYPRDSGVPKAIYLQANAFRLLKKNTEAKLFYEELIERFPRTSYAKRARGELKRL